MASDQETLDRLLGVTPDERRALAQGRDAGLLAKHRESGRARELDLLRPIALFAIAASGALLGTGLQGRAALLPAGFLVSVALVLVAHQAWKRRKFRRTASDLRVRVVEGSATTLRYWFPSYGEVSRLCADLVIGDERFVVPASFDDWLVEGPVRLIVRDAEPSSSEAKAARGFVIAVELLPGAELVRRAPGKPPPKDFLRIEPAD